MSVPVRIPRDGYAYKGLRRQDQEGARDIRLPPTVPTGWFRLVGEIFASSVFITLKRIWILL